MSRPDYDDEAFNRGVTHTVDLLAKTIGSDGWVSGDGSEDYDEDLARTLLNILEAKRLYDSEDAKFLSEKCIQTSDERETKALCALANRINELSSYWAKSPDGAEWQMFTITVTPTDRNRIMAALRRPTALSPAERS